MPQVLRPIVPGETFGKLTVIAQADSPRNRRRVLVRCTCGTERTTRFGHLVSGKTRSCGCAPRPPAAHFRTHGLSSHPLYTVWVGIHQRAIGRWTDQPGSAKTRHYADRGIRVCKRWHKFKNFYADMAPPGGRA
jgi:hypothetical protein